MMTKLMNSWTQEQFELFLAVLMIGALSTTVGACLWLAWNFLWHEPKGFHMSYGEAYMIVFVSLSALIIFLRRQM
jgi:hypothetical protein